ncbi:hypothetical protein TNCV_1188941 [Trichonephila clavipes]|nr:hypothetical protein TNCV_1188941 [Trichonephila clavipes]
MQIKFTLYSRSFIDRIESRRGDILESDTKKGNPETLDTLRSFTDARETLLQASTLYDTPAHCNGLSISDRLPDSLGPSQTYSDPSRITSTSIPISS